MTDVKWIKIATDIFEDDKMLLIADLPKGDSIVVIWIKLLCLAGKLNTSGVMIMDNGTPYTDKMLASIFNRKISLVKAALQIFEKYGMITFTNDIISISNWGKHQNLDQLEKKRTDQREYMRKYRSKQKDISCKSNCKTNSNITVNEKEPNSKANVSRLDKDKDIDIDNNIYIHNVCNSNINNNAPLTEDLQSLTNELSERPAVAAPDSGVHPLTSAEYAALVEEYGKDFVDKRVARSKCCKGAFNLKTLEIWCKEDYEKQKKYVVYKHDPFSDA